MLTENWTHCDRYDPDLVCISKQIRYVFSFCWRKNRREHERDATTESRRTIKKNWTESRWKASPHTGTLCVFSCEPTWMALGETSTISPILSRSHRRNRHFSIDCVRIDNVVCVRDSAWEEKKIGENVGMTSEWKKAASWRNFPLSRQ